MRRIFCALTIAAALFLSATVVARADEICFLLREEGGKLALYREDIAEPLMLYDPPLGLPAADAELLREGVRFKSQAEVARLIEDLGAE